MASELEVRDELDKVSVDQLHKVVVQLGTNCFELKKLCVTVLLGAATLIATFTRKQLDESFFVASFVAVLLFWVLDAQSYYYQEKLRARMKDLAEDIARRHQMGHVVDGVGMPLTKRREERTVRQRVVAALFNWSMFFYAALSVLVLILAWLYALGAIQTPAGGASENG